MPIFKIYRKNIVLYHHGDGSTCRFPIEVSLVQNIRGGKYIDWDYNNNRFKLTADNAAKKNKILDSWQEVADAIIIDLQERKIKPSGDLVKNALLKHKESKSREYHTKLLDYYEVFHAEKEQQFQDPKRSKESLKDYTSLRNTLEDYETERNTTILLRDIDHIWLRKFNTWLQDKRKEGSKTKGELRSVKTRQKRFSSLNAFFNFIHQDDKSLVQEENYIRKNMTGFSLAGDSDRSKNKSTLERKDVFTLAKVEPKSNAEAKAKDLFLVANLTALRWRDVSRITPKTLKIKEIPNGADPKRFRNKLVKACTIEDIFICDNHLILMPWKTRNKPSPPIVEIPISPIVNEILERRGYNLKILSQQSTNIAIKEIMKKIDYVFDDASFSFHDGRRSFITTLCDEVPLNQLMKMTGHTELSTLKKYIDDKKILKEATTNKVLSTFTEKTEE